MAATEPFIHGMDTIPQQIVRDFPDVFKNYLPGWAVTGEYNFQPGAVMNKTAGQLQILVQNGPHPWINEALDGLLKGPEWEAAGRIPGKRTEMLSALVNFMSEANSKDALITNGARTGGYVAYSSLADPHLAEKLGQAPTGDIMRDLDKDGLKGTRKGLSWTNILNSDAGKEAIALNPRVVRVNGVDTLEYTGKVQGGRGFFSRSQLELTTRPWIKPGSTTFGRRWMTQEGLTIKKNGTVLQNDVAVREAEAKALLATKLQNGSRIATLQKPAVKLLQKLGKLAKPLSFLAIALLSSTAASAQTTDGYKNDDANAQNKAFIEELFALGVGGLAGLVAGALAGAASFGLLAIPVGIAAGVAGDKAGRVVGAYFYDNFTGSANEIAEWIAPMLAPVGDLINAGVDAATALGGVIADVAGMIFGAVTEAFEYVGDLVSGIDGLFGLNGPLFGPGGPLHALVEKGKKEKYLTNEGTWAYDGFDSILYGTDGDDILIHDEGLGEAYGGKGDDVLIGVFPKFAAAGTPLFDDVPDLLAQEDKRLLLDGGEGNDWVITIGGDDVPDKKDGAVTAGGLGRDWIFNTSPNGIIWGDVANSSKDLSTGDWFYYEARTNADGVEEQVRVDVIDNKTNSDNIWYWADTTLMDAGHSDVLKYFGIPMTGGDANGGLAGYAIYNGLFGAAIGMANIARYISGQANDWTGEIYVDHIQPWILYSFKADEEGYLDLYITNAFEQIFDGLNAALDLGQQDATPKIHKGWMKIENVEVVGSRLGVLQQEAANTVLSNGKVGGSLNMVFRAVNPLQALLPLYDLVPGIIGQALKYSVMADGVRARPSTGRARAVAVGAMGAMEQPFAAAACNDNDAWQGRAFLMNDNDDARDVLEVA